MGEKKSWLWKQKEWHWAKNRLHFIFIFIFFILNKSVNIFDWAHCVRYVYREIRVRVKILAQFEVWMGFLTVSRVLCGMSLFCVVIFGMGSMRYSTNDSYENINTILQSIRLIFDCGACYYYILCYAIKLTSFAYTNQFYVKRFSWLSFAFAIFL